MSDPLAAEVIAGDRRALAKAVTLVESTRQSDRARAGQLLAALAPHSEHALRVGVSGPPGAGKSTLLNRLGTRLVDDGHQVAVLAVDPASAVGGGSVLGDKTRMPDLANRGAFIRPSPGAGGRGGVAHATRPAILVCEAAGHDVVVVETIGVGQSEFGVAAMVDTMVLLVQPGAGDELQGIKRGVMELADVVAVTKADGELAPAARAAAADHRRALGLLRSRTLGWQPPVVLTSAVQGTGLDDLWDAVRDHRAHLEHSGQLSARRREQRLEWFEDEIVQLAMEWLGQSSRDANTGLRAQVAAGRLPPPVAASRLWEQLRGR